MATEQKENENVSKEETKKDFIKSPTIIETTYEKVLSIINKVKEFIKKTSTDSNSLIEDLEWVIKVITNKSLYTYELKQAKLSKKNLEYNKFINFVTKYNEEVIEMNKKHDIVSGILSIGKKGDMLLKPSLCLKKILPDELKNMDLHKIKEKKLRKNNFIYVFGNTILNLYNKEMEKRKQSFENTENSGSIEKCNYNSLDHPNENKNDDINIFENKSVDKCDKNKNNKENSNKNNENNKTSEVNIKNKNKNYIIKKKLDEKEEISKEKNDNTAKIKNKQKSENMIEKDNRNNGNNFPKYNTDENYNSDIFNEQRIKAINTNLEKKNFNINIQRIRIGKEKEKLSDSKIKFKSNNLSHKKNLKGATKLTKYEQITFNSIKKAMKNYYIKFAYNEGKGTNMEIYELKGNFNSNNNNRHLYKTNYNNNTNFNFNDMNKKFKSTNIDRGFMLYKNSKYTTFPHNMVGYNRKKNKNNNLYTNQKSEDIFKNYKIVKSLKDNLIFESNENKFDNIIYETSHNFNSNNKFHLSKRFQITAEKKKDNLSEKEIFKSFKTENNQVMKANNSEKNIINKNKIAKKEENNKILEENKNNVNNTNEKNIKKPNSSQISISNLVDKYFAEVKMITDKDFHIFDFKDKVGHKNVLPIMGYVILKTLGLIDSKIISTKKLDSFLTTVSDNYKMATLYHNSLHGADVTQSLCVYFLNTNAEEICETTVLDLLGMIVSAMGHDLGHPGLNNNFHINASTDLAITYNDASCLENFHTSYLFKIIRKEENNILEKFSVQNYKSIRKRMISQILATDMANHGETISLIRSKIKAWQEEGTKRFNLLSGNEKTKFDEQQLLLNYMIHMADLGHNCKKFEISIIWIKLLCEEFWQQGDKEKAKGLPISFMCDRDKIDVPASQVGFLRGFILSSFDCLVAMFPNLKYTVENAENNIKRWKKLQDEKRLLGWTPKKEKKEENEDKKEIKNSEIKKEEIKNEEIKEEENKNEEIKKEENINKEIKNEEIKNEENKNIDK